MLQIWFLLCLFLIFLIFIRIPKENSGLNPLLNSSQFFGTPSQLEQIVNVITGTCVLGYVIIAFKLNMNV